MRTLTLLKWEDKHGCQKKFRLITKVSSRWPDFGRLFGREEDELEGLRVYDAKQCWCKVVCQWLDDGGTVEYPATWGGFILALEDVELWEIARELEMVLGSAIVHPPVQTSGTDTKPPAEPATKLSSIPHVESPPSATEHIASNTIALSNLCWFSPSHPHFSLAQPPQRYFSLVTPPSHPILLNEFPSPQRLLLKLVSPHPTPTSLSEREAHSPSRTASLSPPPSP